MSSNLTESDRLLRLVPKEPAFIGDDTQRATWRAIRPTKGDVEDAKARARSIGVTVWDRSLTTVEQAEAFLQPKPRAAFELTVGDVSAARAHWGLQAARVVRDPISRKPAADLPGASGHCGIEGLERGAKMGESERQWEIRLSFLASRLDPILNA